MASPRGKKSILSKGKACAIGGQTAWGGIRSDSLVRMMQFPTSVFSAVRLFAGMGNLEIHIFIREKSTIAA
jgi:hypothetical protein